MKSDPTKLDFLNEFSQCEGVVMIKILGHTGRTIFSALDSFARLRHEAGLHDSVHAHLLLRDEGVETSKRRDQITTAIKIIKRLNDQYEWLYIEFRFYSAIQTLRGAIVELDNGTKSTYFSAYHWHLPDPGMIGHAMSHPIKTKAVKWSSIITKECQEKPEHNELALLLENWFDYYWGPGIIHTVAFDFDDTIIDTYKEKIEAWVFAINETIKKYGPTIYFLPEFTLCYGPTENDKFKCVKNIVDKYPGKDEILQQVLKDDTPSTIMDDLEKKRSSYRYNALFPRNKTEEVLSALINNKLFHGVKSALERLNWRGYSLAIASLTDEERIEKALKIANIPCIDTIVGKSQYKNRELSKYLPEKIFLIRKIANLAGIPVNRVLYIGDHHRDEHAANEVGASFIHARLIKQIEPSNDPDTLHFEDYGKLGHLVDEIESRAKARDILPQQMTNNI